MKKQNPRLLLADACVKHRRETAQFLEDNGYEVIPAASGADVLIQCEIDVPDIIVMDVELGDMEGYDVCVSCGVN